MTNSNEGKKGSFWGSEGFAEQNGADQRKGLSGDERKVETNGYRREQTKT